jgi:hypothetical protein
MRSGVLGCLLVLLVPRVGVAQEARLGDAREAALAADSEVTEAVPPPPDARAERSAEPSAADPVRAARLEAWLDVRASDDQRDAILAGVSGFVGGAVGIGGGVWIWTDQLFGLTDFGRPMIGSLLVALGALELGLGIVALAAPPVSAQRLARWRLAIEGGLGAEELAGFEGELRADADAARQGRWITMAGGAGLALAGAGVATLAGTLEGLSELDRLYGGVVGGVYGLFGLVLFATSFIESPTETAWSQYSLGQGPRASAIAIRPIVGAGSLGLAGTF